MRFKQEVENKVIITLKDPRTTKSKTMTVYDCELNEMIKVFEKLVEANNK